MTTANAHPHIHLQIALQPVPYHTVYGISFIIQLGICEGLLRFNLLRALLWFEAIIPLISTTNTTVTKEVNGAGYYIPAISDFPSISLHFI